MRSYTALLGALTSATAVSAQLALPSSLFGLSFSPQCQQAIISVFTNGTLGQCFPVANLLPALTSNVSIVPLLDNFMSDLCYNSPCTNETLQSAASTVLAGCSSDLSGEGLSDSVVTTTFSAYPLVREVLCLKTTDYYTSESYGGILGEPPIPISEAYNTTDGVFCVTSLLTQLSAYFGANFTVPYITAAVSGQNETAVDLALNISSTILCNECIFAAVDVIEAAYPVVGDVPIAAIYGALNMSTSVNTTVNELLNSTCAYEDLAVSTNGTLPANISVSLINSTFPFTLTNGTTTFAPAVARRSLEGKLFGSR